MKKILFLMALFLISISFVNAFGMKSYDLFNADYSSSDDGITFVNRPLVMEIQSSNIMVACFDYSNPNCDENPTYDECFAVSQKAWNDCKADFGSLPASSPKEITSTPGTQFMPVTNADATCADARYYKNCDGLGGGQGPYSVTQEPYLVISARKYDCDDGIPSWDTYDAEGYTGLWFPYDYHDEVACPAGTKCSEAKDDVWVYTAYGYIDNPCVEYDWGPCTKDFGYPKNKCIGGKCSPCKSGQCTLSNYKVCLGNGKVFNYQHYCEANKYYETVAKCTLADHLGCEKRGDYYCTLDGIWRWGKCPFGCASDECITQIPQMTVTPSLLEFWT